MNLAGHRDRWNFYLAISLRLKIHFSYIHIKYNNSYKCFIGNVIVKSYLSHFESKNKYCGIHSNIVNYSPFRNTQIMVIVKYRVQYEVVMLYSVIDCNIIVSQPTNPIKPVKLKLRLHFLQRNLSVQIFHIWIEKYQQIQFHIFKSMKLLTNIHDGSGILSAILKPKNYTKYQSHHLASTFQSIVFIWIKSSLQINEKMLITYSGKYYSKNSTHSKVSTNP